MPADGRWRWYTGLTTVGLTDFRSRSRNNLDWVWRKVFHILLYGFFYLVFLYRLIAWHFLFITEFLFVHSALLYLLTLGDVHRHSEGQGLISKYRALTIYFQWNYYMIEVYSWRWEHSLLIVHAPLCTAISASVILHLAADCLTLNGISLTCELCASPKQ